MFVQSNLIKTSVCALLYTTVLLAASHAMADMNGDLQQVANGNAETAIPALAAKLQVGDIVFIRVAAKPFREVAAATNSWTNHVGIVIDTAGDEPLIGESTFPFSRTTPLSKFIARSEHGRVAAARTRTALTHEQQQKIFEAASKRSGIFYDTGFNLHSRRQFCSRYVREVLHEASGIHIGEIETFSTLLSRNPEANLAFWKTWYFGHIPWQRETITPASLLQSRQLALVFDGVATDITKN